MKIIAPFIILCFIAGIASLWWFGPDDHSALLHEFGIAAIYTFISGFVMAVVLLIQKEERKEKIMFLILGFSWLLSCAFISYVHSQKSPFEQIFQEHASQLDQILHSMKQDVQELNPRSILKPENLVNTAKAAESKRKLQQFSSSFNQSRKQINDVFFNLEKQLAAENTEEMKKVYREFMSKKPGNMKQLNQILNLMDRIILIAEDTLNLALSLKGQLTFKKKVLMFPDKSSYDRFKYNISRMKAIHKELDLFFEQVDSEKVFSD